MQGSRAMKEARRGGNGSGMIPRKKYASGGSLMYSGQQQQNAPMGNQPNNQMGNQQPNNQVTPPQSNQGSQSSVMAQNPNQNMYNQQTRRYYKKGGNVDDKWMQDVHPKKGALHKALKIPDDKKIPTTLLEKEKNAKSPLMRKRATLALNYRGE